MLEKLIAAKTSNEIEKILTAYGANKADDWLPIGNTEFNAGAVDANANNPIIALKEIVTNAVDAVTESFPESLKENFNDLKRLKHFYNKSKKVWIDFDTTKARTSRQKNGAFNAVQNIAIIDKGIGQPAEKIASTFFNLFAGTKQPRPYLYGHYGFGGKGALKFSEMILVITKTKNKNEIAVSAAKLVGNYDEYKQYRKMYVYHRPIKLKTELVYKNIHLKHGSVVKLLNVDIPPMTRHELSKRLTYKLSYIPTKINIIGDTKHPVEGLLNLAETHISSRKFYQVDEIDFKGGKLKIHNILRVKNGKLHFYRHSHEAVIISYKGQTYSNLSESLFMKDDINLQYFKKRLSIVVELDQLPPKVTSKALNSDRDGISNAFKESLTKVITKYLNAEYDNCDAIQQLIKLHDEEAAENATNATLNFDATKFFNNPALRKLLKYRKDGPLTQGGFSLNPDGDFPILKDGEGDSGRQRSGTKPIKPINGSTTIGGDISATFNENKKSKLDFSPIELVNAETLDVVTGEKFGTNIAASVKGDKDSERIFRVNKDFIHLQNSIKKILQKNSTVDIDSEILNSSYLRLIAVYNSVKPSLNGETDEFFVKASEYLMLSVIGDLELKYM